eukprot:CAMPEP_0171106688 /NCGR_PEP_ID=MMETSP0766_2-20121228/65291_1 /TAXON_ID=439317 /ORGANISM="Gambierdiscus australes, Strain CAWD 149" /LENGTH=344 /DNA_ID=CAMNT_0011567837 /DNA_START=280 /DNA_END=1314 /DNA_ORIENTATION=-
MNLAVLGLTVWALFYYLNFWVKYTVEAVGAHVLGTDVSLETLDIDLQEGRIAFTNLTVASPPAYHGTLLSLGSFVFDVSPGSVLAAWASGWSAPVELQEVSGLNLQVTIDMNWTTSPDKPTICNAEEVIRHMNSLNQQLEPVGMEVTTPPPPKITDVLQAAALRVKADKIRFVNISAGVLIRPFLGEPLTYELGEIVVKDVGKDSNGVYLAMLVEILARAVLMAVIRSAPKNVRANLARVLGLKLFRNLDSSQVLYDAGEGLRELGEFSGWAAGEAASLPLKFAELQMRITGAALKTGMDMNLAATKTGLQLTGAAMRAQWEATKAVTKLQTGFLTGFTRGFLR